MKKSRKTRLIIMAHPDDPELSSGGTIAQWAQEGTVHYIIVSCGEKGTWDRNASPFMVAEKREKEAHSAARFLGVKKVIFLRKPDGAVDAEGCLKFELAALIRYLKPYTIVTNDPWYRMFHPDHKATGQAVIEAIMMARDWHFCLSLAEVGLRPHRPRELLLTPTDRATFINDITATFVKKMKAIKRHKSQLRLLPHWEKRITQYVMDYGKRINTAYAEGFYRMRL
jgi:LmbE family N-acetylglucosaminyl deacetylase